MFQNNIVRQIQAGALAAAALMGIVANPFVALAEEEPGERIQRLIERLGSEQFSLREAAAAELLELGASAHAQLAAATRAADPEVRAQARRLMGAIQGQLYHRRLEAFLNFQPLADDSDAETFPGWERFRSRFGDDAARRKMFVDLLLADADFLIAYERGNDALLEYMRRAMPLWQQASPALRLNLSIHAMIAATEPDLALPPDVEAPLVSLVAHAVAELKLRGESSRPVGELLRQYDQARAAIAQARRRREAASTRDRR